jgi:hypothetical protein
MPNMGMALQTTGTDLQASGAVLPRYSDGSVSYRDSSASYTDGYAPATRIALLNKGEVYHLHGQLFQWHDRYRPGFAYYIDSSALLAIWKTLPAGMSTALQTARMTQSTTGTICQHVLNLLCCVWNIWSTIRTFCQLQDRLNLHRCV